MRTILKLALTTLTLSVIVLALDKPMAPTRDYKEIMFANASLVDLTAAGDFNADPRVRPGAGSLTLRQLAAAKDYDELAKGAQALNANYEKLKAFWAANKADDALNLITAGLKAASDLQIAAQAKSDKDIAAAQGIVEKTCRDCHTLHRVVMMTDSSFQIRIASNPNTAAN